VPFKSFKSNFTWKICKFNHAACCHVVTKNIKSTKSKHFGGEYLIFFHHSCPLMLFVLCEFCAFSVTARSRKRERARVCEKVHFNKVQFSQKHGSLLRIIKQCFSSSLTHMFFTKGNRIYTTYIHTGQIKKSINI
jgi:hypothetical protein